MLLLSGATGPFGHQAPTWSGSRRSRAHRSQSLRDLRAGAFISIGLVLVIVQGPRFARPSSDSQQARFSN